MPNYVATNNSYRIGGIGGMFAKFLPLLWANLGRDRVRSFLTFATIAVAFMLFGVLQAVRTSLLGGADLAGADRLITYHKVSRIKALPLSYVTRMRSIDGVAAVCPLVWMGGVYQSDKNLVRAYVVDPQAFFDVYREYQVSAEARKAFIAERNGALVGSNIAQRFGWKVGDTIPMRSNIYTRLDGSTAWPLKIVGIYEAKHTENIFVYLHYDYFNRSHTYEPDVVGWMVTRINDASRTAAMSRLIDENFANSSAETATTSEGADELALASQMGSIGSLITAIAGAVFLTMLLVTTNTMAQAIRDRTSEIGILKTLGFSVGQVLFLITAETMLVIGLGAIAGLVLAIFASNALAVAVVEYFPLLYIPQSTWLLSAALVIVFGVVAAVMPCAFAWRLKIVDAFRTL
jgi:putative ABC transport system permease protein